MQENNIGSKIRNYRQKKGMTQDALAAELHVSAQAVSKWENGQTMPDISFLVPLSKILGLGLYELLGGDLRDVYEKKWREADELCDDLALLAAQEALSEFPEDEEFLYRRAVAEYKLGKLEEGWKADITLLDMRVPQFVPFRDPYSMICYSADGSETDTVILDGKVVYKNKEFITIDIEEVYAKVAEMKEVL